jgi:hypothetical protein
VGLKDRNFKAAALYLDCLEKAAKQANPEQTGD